MAFESSWLRAPDFLGASEAGFRLGLSRQQMLEQADEHAAEIALRADEMRQRSSQEQANRQQEQNQFSAGQSLKEAALRQQGLLGESRIQNEADRTSSYNDLNQSKVKAMQQKQFTDEVNSHLHDIALKNLPSLLESNPNISKAEILSRFPMLKPGEIPSTGRMLPDFTETSVRQAPNKLYGVGQGLSTNVPPYISLTNTTTRVRSPQPVEEVPAGESLRAPTAESVDQLPTKSDNIPQAHIDYLLANPDSATDFDQKYGAGASEQYLKGQ